VNGWLRAYDDEPGLSRFAGGLDGGVEHVFGSSWRGHIDALWDDGWGGRRIGGAADAAFRPQGRMWWRGRVIVLGVAEDATANVATAHRFVTTSSVLSLTYRIAETVGVHGIAEANYDEIHEFQFRALGVVDLNFAPEP
jgi:hypothetical protein